LNLPPKAEIPRRYAPRGGGIARFFRLRRAGIQDIDRFTGGEFEDYLESLFTRKGYHVRQIPLSGDYGGDLLVSKNGTATIIQAKRYESSVGVPAVQQAFTAAAYYDADRAITAASPDRPGKSEWNCGTDKD